MTTTATSARAAMRNPTVARLGFDDGWLVLGPHFLKLGLPVLLVDHRLVGPVDGLGLESFGSRDPRRPLESAKIRAVLNGGGVSLWAASAAHQSLLAAHWFEPSPAAVLESQPVQRLILIVGDTYDVELTWSALWTCFVGIATIARTSYAMAEPTPGSIDNVLFV